MEGVHIQIFLSQCRIGLYIVVKFDDFNRNALFSRFFSDFIHNFRMRTGSYANFNFFVIAAGRIIAAATGNKCGSCYDEGQGEAFFQGNFHNITSFH